METIYDIALVKPDNVSFLQRNARAFPMPVDLKYN